MKGTSSPQGVNRLLRLSFLGLALTNGAPAAAFDLLEGYMSALSRDARFAAARATLDAGKEKYPQGLSQLLPKLDIGGSKTYYDADIEYRGTTIFDSGERNYDNTDYGLTLTQPLYRKQNFAAYRQGEALADMATAQFSEAQQELILRVAQAYFDVLAALDNTQFARARQESLATQLEHVRHRLAAGASTITEMYDAKARSDIATAQEFSARNDLEIKKRTLWRIVGIESDHIATVLKDMPLQPAQPNDLNRWLATAAANNPTVRVRRENVRVAAEELERARGGHFPTLDLVLGYSKVKTTGSLYTTAESDGKWKSAGLQLLVPLYQGGYVNSRVREMVANRAKAIDELEEANGATSVAVQAAFLNVTHGINQVEAMQQALISSESALAANKTSYEGGVRKIVDVLNATQQLYEVQRDLSRARYDYLLARLRLKAASGTLVDDDVVAINALLDRAGASLRAATTETAVPPPETVKAPVAD